MSSTGKSIVPASASHTNMPQPPSPLSSALRHPFIKQVNQKSTSYACKHTTTFPSNRTTRVRRGILQNAYFSIMYSFVMKSFRKDDMFPHAETILGNCKIAPPLTHPHEYRESVGSAVCSQMHSSHVRASSWQFVGRECMRSSFPGEARAVPSPVCLENASLADYPLRRWFV